MEGILKGAYSVNSEMAEGLTLLSSPQPPPAPPPPPPTHTPPNTFPAGKGVKANVASSSSLSKRVDRFGFCVVDKEPKKTKITETVLSKFDLLLDAYLFGLTDILFNRA